MEDQFKRGDQIIHIPPEASGFLSHPSCETGFVTFVVNAEWVFCRYWSKTDAGETRPKEGSHLTHTHWLKAMDTVPQIEVYRALYPPEPEPTPGSPDEEE